MPSEVVSYFHTLLVTGIIGVALVAAFQANSSGIKSGFEEEELREILEVIAAEGTELVTSARTNGSTSTLVMRLPISIGERNWWARLVSGSEGSWAEGGFGPESLSSVMRVWLPHGVSASGTFRGGFGVPALKCSVVGGQVFLSLTSQGGG